MGLLANPTYKPTKRHKEHPEYDLQCKALSYIRKHHPDWVFASTHNESAYSRKDYFKRSGLCIGFPDVILIRPNGVLFLEFKAPKPYRSQVSREQKEIEGKINNLLGVGCHFYIYSLEEFIEVVEE